MQRGDTLGERLDAALGDLRERGFDQSFAIGSDSPDLPEGHLTAAFDLLDDDATDVVFGPTEDGGYYVIGWKKPWPHVVTTIEMSTSSVLTDSLVAASSVGAQVALCPAWYDVDDPVDVTRLSETGLLSPTSATNVFLTRRANR